MKDIIEELWYGNIVPHEMYLGKNQEYKSVLSLVCEIREKINRTLTEDQIELLDRYDKTVNELNSISQVEAFKYGLLLGAKLMMEIKRGDETV